MRGPTFRTMARLHMERSAPILIRIYKEENTLEVWKRVAAGASRYSALIRSVSSLEILGRRLQQGTARRLKGFMTFDRSK